MPPSTLGHGGSLPEHSHPPSSPPTCPGAVLPHVPWNSPLQLRDWDGHRFSFLPYNFGTFLLVPQHHLQDSLGSPAGVGARVRGVWLLQGDAPGHLSWGTTLWNQAQYLCHSGPRHLDSRPAFCHFLIRLAGQFLCGTKRLHLKANLPS